MLRTDENAELIDEIISSISLPYNFGINSCDGEDPKHILDTVERQLMENQKTRKALIFHGVSKMVILHPELDVVIKIPFNGQFVITDENPQGEFEYFTSSPADDNDDYCSAEVDYYLDAKDHDVNEFFAKIECGGWVDEIHPYYLQEKVIPCKEDYHIRRSSAQNREIVKSNFSNTELDPTWLAVGLEYYGLHKVNLFCRFAEKIELSFDNHEGNYGYREDGSPCWLDYSGWCE